MGILRHFKFGVKIAGGFSVILILMCAISVTIFININALVDSSSWVDHTHKVIRVAEGVSSSMVDMETGQRGFMITGEDEYLDPYIKGQASFDKLINKGQKLTSDNPLQTERWKKIKALKVRWLNEVAQNEINARREVTKGTTSINRFKTVSARTVGKEIFDNIRSVLAVISAQFSNNLEGQLLMTKITLDVVNMETGQRGFLLTGKDASLDPFTEGQTSLKIHLAELKRLAEFSFINESEINKLEQLITDWVAQAATPEIDARRDMNQYTVTIEDIAIMMKNGDGKTLMDSTRSILNAIVEEEEKLIGIRAEEQAAISSFTINFTILGTLLAVILGLAVTLTVTRAVVNPLKKTNALLKVFSEGDLTQRLDIETKDEMGEMSHNFNHFAKKLQESIKQISDSTIELVNASEALSSVTEETNKGVQNQKVETEQVATAITEMSATVEEVAANAVQASQAASEADSESKTGYQVVHTTIDAIENLASEINDAASVIEQLKGDSENIGTVIDVIKSIAEQTNLLALNAAIEAARAGDQGRGFAVVADEVRTLAQRTQESTTEIESLVESLQAGAEKSVMVMEQSRNNAHGTVDQAQTAGNSLASISQAVDSILQINTQIATAAEQQTAVTNDISRSILSIQTIAEETAAGAQQTSNSSTALASLGEQLKNIVGQFKV